MTLLFEKWLKNACYKQNYNIAVISLSLERQPLAPSS